MLLGNGPDYIWACIPKLSFGAAALASSPVLLLMCLWMQLKPWKLEGDDHTLLDLMPFLEAVYKANVPDIRKVVESYEGEDIPVAFRYKQIAQAYLHNMHASALSGIHCCLI